MQPRVFYVVEDKMITNFEIESLVSLCVNNCYLCPMIKPTIDSILLNSGILTSNGMKGLYAQHASLQYIFANYNANTQLEEVRKKAITLTDIPEMAYFHITLKKEYTQDDLLLAPTLEAVQHVYASIVEKIDEATIYLAMENAAKEGNLNIVKWLYIKHRIPTYSLIGIAMYNERIEVVDWLFFNTTIYWNNGKGIYWNSKKNSTKLQKEEIKHISVWLAARY